ncbi:phosphoenolpyruvate carboxykinase (ATP) [Candidatus Margulisiibacteriota bacterium]
MGKHKLVEKLGLDKVGVTSAEEVFHNLPYDELYKHELDSKLKGFDKGTLTEFGAVAVDTGKFTGRSPKDKYIVKEPETQGNVWWTGTGSDNKPISEDTWEQLKALSLKQLNGKQLYVVDCFCGAHEDTRINVRVITEVAWMAHFAKNMFIRPTDDELDAFKPDWTILHSCKATFKDFEKNGMRSEVFAAFNIKERTTCIGGTWYGGEIKKGIFSMMNYFLPLKGIGSFHCSANTGEDGETALFFGLSGTGKTTLSADPKRKLIGDDEHGWDGKGIFNFEAGCYAKCINLSEENEPDIYHAIKRNALLENVDVDKSGKIDFASDKKTQNTRVSYPIFHINNIVKPVSEGTHPKRIIFLACDAYGVLPPVAKLNKEQAMYHFLSGYTAKVAGTELGVTEPQATFSACFGQAFLLLHPVKYAEILGEKMEEHNSQAYLVNTGWSGGAYGVGSRMSLKITRRIIDAIFDGTLYHAKYDMMPVFDLRIPQELEGVPTEILNPKNTWEDKKAYDETLKKLAGLFKENFEKKFTDDVMGKSLVSFGPKV